MTTSRPHSTRASGRPQGVLPRLVGLLAFIALILLLAPAGASASPSASSPRAHISASVLREADRAHAAAHRAVAARAAALRACERRHPSRCAARRRALRRARARLRASEARLAHDAQYYYNPNWRYGASATAAPSITVSGQSLSWNRVGGVEAYVFVRKVPGRTDEYSVLHTTSLTPPAVPGATVTYGVRTDVSGSAWSSLVTITYPKSAGSSEASKSEAPKHEAPTSEAPKSEAPTSEAPKSEAPPAEGGSEQREQPQRESGSGSFEMGLVAGSAIAWELPWMEALRAGTVRMEFAINTPVSAMEPTIAAYANAGIRPLLLAGFYGRLPSSGEAQNLANWAAAFGPGGSFWKGKGYPAGDAVSDIEFGNETSYSYQFSETASASNWYALPSYAARAQTYALRFKEAVTAMHAANSQVGLLAQADDGGSGTPTWVDNMFAAVPNLAQLASGWTVHPYGPHWEATINRLISSTQAEGAPASIPLYATEFGISSDNGRCLQENFGYNRCMTYGEAASTLETAVSGMRAKYGSRLRALYLFQARDQDSSGSSTEREGYCGALQSDQAAKGAYTGAVEKLLTANP
ncbi:MAG TPA: hypothetical protein VMG62_08010 [Solirubrobacteraceae bacterium]|nr:hypothetical protein [Solirubrobacteraceae bacterium]